MTRRSTLILYLGLIYLVLFMTFDPVITPMIAGTSTLIGLSYCARLAYLHFLKPSQHPYRLIGQAVLLFWLGLVINFVLALLPSRFHPVWSDALANVTLTLFLFMTALVLFRLIDWSSFQQNRLLYLDGFILFGMVFVFSYVLILRRLPDFARTPLELVAMTVYCCCFSLLLLAFLMLYTTGLRGKKHQLLVQSVALFCVTNLGYYIFLVRDQLDLAAFFLPLYPVSLWRLLLYFHDAPSVASGQRQLSRPYLPYLSLVSLLIWITFFDVPRIVYLLAVTILFSLFLVRQVLSERLNRQLLQEHEVVQLDLADRVKAKTALLEIRKEEYRRLFLDHPQPILQITRTGAVQAMNPAAHVSFGEQIPERLLNQVQQKITQLESSLKLLLQDHDLTYETTLIPVPDHDYVYVLLSDITEKLEQQQWLEELGYHDALTRLPNRRYFEDFLQERLAQIDAGSLLFLDLDGFKQVNDSYGHDAGDYVLQETANRLRLHLEEHEVAARLGGDEFIVFLPRSKAETIRYTEDLIDQLNQPFWFQGTAMSVTPSIGIARYPEDGATTSLLLIRADEAMYSVKQHEKNAYRFK
ncbi:diguanylate cyclase [Exiguobacterium sibiricum 255-15]|uniref:Diguanylate cyclase n=1 Tax=Exiguobacterium sibiricum (strain DSM 17290 / CCUG 55495 / CIP 109462 / JCM 13490 / 255-15) TaxID=262543 RepID=B1YLI1_EXIS2|nr:GGDEF domain-containing protein [Exiguobacterium sibiricum]ACB61886.1 diguanylate cyclase [Exiguobacterium sibiricum 255-15]